MSDLPDAEKVLRIEKVLNKTPTPPTPPPTPSGGYICGLRPSPNSPVYIAEAKTETKARSEALKSCVDGETPKFPFPIDIPQPPPGYPGGGFPGGDGGGFPGGGFPGGSFPGPQIECKATKVACEQVTSSQRKYTCTVKSPFGKQPYDGKGRTRLEAQKDAINTCLASGEHDSHCFESQFMTCN
jgi:hypothetical protein